MVTIRINRGATDIQEALEIWMTLIDELMKKYPGIQINAEILFD